MSSAEPDSGRPSSQSPLPAPNVGAPVKGSGSRRSRNGCWTCRGKAAKKRCDEQRPVCGRCSRLGVFCDYNPRPRKPRSTRTAASVSADAAAEATSASRSTASPSPLTLAVTGPSESASSLTFVAQDHDAIRFFRTAFAEFHHTKNPKYGCISIMFDLAREDPMVMHMALALGFLEMDVRRPWHPALQSRTPTHHYSAALRLLAQVVVEEDVTRSIDTMLATLWLMMVYEQQFGDGQGTANHLRGAASLVQQRLKPLIQSSTMTVDALEPESELRILPLTKRSTGNTGSSQNLSLYSVRMLVWISQIDAAAASSGIGGFFNSSLLSVLSESTAECDGDDELGLDTADEFSPATPSTPSPVETLMRMYRHSNPLYRLAWGGAYPQSELLDDLENRSVFNLFTCCCPLRFMVAQLAASAETDSSSPEFRQRAASVARAIQKTASTYSEILSAARELSIATDNSRRLVVNIRNIVPTFYAIQLEFLRLTEPHVPLGGGRRQRLLVREIMKMALQVAQHRGEDGLVRVAWPLFVAVLETDDSLHRTWVMERFERMSVLGKHLSSAHQFLRDAIAIQERTGKRVDVREMMKSYTPFVLS